MQSLATGCESLQKKKTDLEQREPFSSPTSGHSHTLSLRQAAITSVRLERVWVCLNSDLDFGLDWASDYLNTGLSSGLVLGFGLDWALECLKSGMDLGFGTGHDI